MSDPVIVPRAEHTISRRNIDPEALKVLYRLHEHRYAAYLVGGSVRDLLLGRRPKDFDIGTDAHPYQIKKMFRNCWIIGRRFRLAHIKFGPKTIEVATFRRIVTDGPDLVEPDTAVVASAGPESARVSGKVAADPAAPTWDAEHHSRGDTDGQHGKDHHAKDHRAKDQHATDQHAKDELAGIIHRDNTFGTPEEDAFRRDFTINGLFYDIATYSVIDYVGGLEDLAKRVVRSIGDPRVRFVEDPVRMLRAAVMAARLEFDLDPLVSDAIAEHRALILKASPARLLEEYYKILRSGCSEATFRALSEVGLLELITPELKSPPAAVWESLARLDRYRQQFPSAPPEFTNTLLIGALLEPLGALRRPTHSAGGPHAERLSFGMLPVARKDVERLRQVAQMLPRLADPALPPRVARGITHRPAFIDAIEWLQVFGDDPGLVAHWKEQRQHRAHSPGSHPPGTSPVHTGAHESGGRPGAGDAGDDGFRRRRRRRRRGRNRRGGGRPV